MGFSPFSGTMFSVVPIIIIAIFVILICVIIYRLIRSGLQWKKNNESPILTVSAKLVTKRMDVNYYHHSTVSNDMHMSSSTSYYVTFEVESGDRMEFKVPDAEYGVLVESDDGMLTFQGTRFLGFERHRAE